MKKENKKNNVEALLFLIEMYQQVQRYYEIEIPVSEIEKDFNLMKKNKNKVFDFKGNKELKELFDVISNNLKRDIKSLKENGIK